jgi:hypothetical protein
MENKKNLKHIDSKLDLERTDKLFDASIAKANAFSKDPYTEKSLKEARAVSTFGNLHLNSAKVKVSVIRLIGYRDELNNLKNNVQKKIRGVRKYKK